MALRGGAIGEHGEMNRRFGQPGELEPGVKAGALRRLRVQGLRITCREIFANSGATRLILDNDEAPRLAEAHRRSKASQFDQALQHARRQRIGPETADVPPPQQQIAQARAKRRVEMDRARRGCESIITAGQARGHDARLMRVGISGHRHLQPRPSLFVAGQAEAQPRWMFRKAAGQNAGAAEMGKQI